MLKFLSSINIISNRISSREKFSPEEITEFKTNIDTISYIISNDAEISKQLAKEILYYLYYVQKLSINCKIFISIINDFFVKITYPTNRSLNKLISASDFDEIMGMCTKDSLPTFILENKKIYTHNFQSISSMKEISKSNSHLILTDYLYAEYLYNILKFDLSLTPLYIESNEMRILLLDDSLDVIDDLTCNKKYDMELVQRLINKTKEAVNHHNESLEIPDFEILLNIFFIISDELYRANLFIDNINSLNDNINSLNLIKDYMIEVIDNAKFVE